MEDAVDTTSESVLNGFNWIIVFDNLNTLFTYEREREREHPRLPTCGELTLGRGPFLWGKFRIVGKSLVPHKYGHGYFWILCVLLVKINHKFIVFMKIPTSVQDQPL